jgi:hypothetical protein
MGHPNFTQPASSPPPLGYPACSASAPCARRLPCREPLGCRFRNPCAPLSPGDSPRVVTAQRSLNARATVCWRLLEGGDRQNLQVNRWKEGHSAAVGWPNTLSHCFRSLDRLNVPVENAATASRRSRAQKLRGIVMPLNVNVAFIQRLKSCDCERLMSCDCAPLAVYLSNAMLYTDESYNSAISPAIPSPRLESHVRFPSFVHPEHGTSHCNEVQ